MPTDNVPDSIVEKVKKLLALSSSPNEHEAALALERANEILLRYNLDLSTIASSSQSTAQVLEKDLLPTFNSSFTWEGYLAVGIASFNFCRVIKCGSSLRFIGQKHNLEVATTMFTWILTQIFVIVYEENKKKKQNANWNYSFCYGISSNLSRRMSEIRFKQNASTTGCTALMSSNDNLISKFMAEKYPNLRRTGATNSTNSSAFSHGRSVGEKVSLGLAKGLTSRRQIAA